MKNIKYIFVHLLKKKNEKKVKSKACYSYYLPSRYPICY